MKLELCSKGEYHLGMWGLERYSQSYPPQLYYIHFTSTEFPPEEWVIYVSIPYVVGRKIKIFLRLYHLNTTSVSYKFWNILSVMVFFKFACQVAI